MFSDESTHPVDPKGRVFVPKRFHPGIPFSPEGARVVVLSAGFDGCLNLFTEDGYRSQLARIDTSTFAGPEVRAMQRLLFRYTSRTSLDASGRLLLPERYRELAGIGEEVVLIGMDSRIEIWAPDRWKRYFEGRPTTLEALYEALGSQAKLGISGTGGNGLVPAGGGGGPGAT